MQFNNLHTYISEIDEKCSYKSSKEASESAVRLLREISAYIVENNLEDTKSSELGEKIILLKQALEKLSVPELKEIHEREIKTKRAMSRAKDVEKVMR